jgi:DNA-binding NarL/FixJ family response regulator
MKILLCDDHKIVRDGLVRILQQLKEITFIGQAGNAEDLLSLLKSERFDIVLLDISLPGRSGLEVLQTLKQKWPATNVLMLSMHPQEQYAIRALKLGASGYLTKDAAAEELLFAVRKVLAGGKYISNSLAESLALHVATDKYQQKHDILSVREFEILIKLANGKTRIIPLCHSA